MKKRRREGKTDYLKRMGLLKSGLPRLAFRKTNKYLLSQYILSHEAKDKIVVGINSKSLLKYGWPKEALGSLKSISAAYFLGMVTGRKIIKKNLETPILDFGLYRTLHKTKLYAFVKGIADAGVKIKYDKKTFPEEDRIKMAKTKKISFEEIKSKINKSEDDPE